MKKRFLITGVCGFVGKYFLEYCYNHPEIEAQMLGLDVLPACKHQFPGFEYRQFDLLNSNGLHEMIRMFEPDYIVHLASISSVSKSWTNPAESFVNNTNIFLNIIEVIRSLQLKTRILSIGSSEEYGNYPVEAMPLNETYQLHPVNPYAVARVSQELLSKLYADNYGVNIIMTRSFNHIGPGQNDIFVVSSFVKQLLLCARNNQSTHDMLVGNVEIIRDFLDVRDVVELYYKILTDGKIGAVYNVCSGRGIKLLDLIHLIADKVGVNANLVIDPTRVRPSDNQVIIRDSGKVSNEFNWQAKHSLSETIDAMIADWKERLK